MNWGRNNIFIKLGFIVLYALVIISCSSSKRRSLAKESTSTCSNVKTGKFQMSAPSLGKTFYFYRNETKQIEHILPDDYTKEFDVTWIGECEYYLTPLEALEFTGFAAIQVVIDSVVGSNVYCTVFQRDDPNGIRTNFVMEKIGEIDEL